MKKMYFTAILVALMLSLVIVSFCFANDGCKKLGVLAENIMTNRQAGADFTEMLDVAENTGCSEELKKLTKNLVIEAYDRSEYSTQEYKERAIRRFKNDVMVKCYKNQ
jgi:hypothetical protein